MKHKKLPGLRFVFERDATIGWEYLIMHDASDITLAAGWSSGTKREAELEAVRHAVDVTIQGLMAMGGAA